MSARGGGRDGHEAEKGRGAAAAAAAATAAAAAAAVAGSSSDSGLLRRLLEDAHSTLDRVRAAFGRYRTAAGARIAELSFALVFAQAENDILAGRLSAVHGEASKEKARADELDRDNKEKDRRLNYVDNADTPSRSRSITYDLRKGLLAALSPFYGDDGEVVDKETGLAGGREKRPRGGQKGHPGASNCQKTDGTFRAYDRQRCPHGHPLITCTGSHGKRVWDVAGPWLLPLAATNAGAAGLQQEMRDILAAWKRRGGWEEGNAAGPTGRALCIWFIWNTYKCDICGEEFDSGHPVAIPGSGAGRITRGRAYATSAELSDAKTARNVAMYGGPSMEGGFVRNMRTAMKDSPEIRAVDKAAEEGIAGADHHQRDEVQIRGDAGSSGGGGGGNAGDKGEEEGDGRRPGVRGRGSARGREDSSPPPPPRRKYVYGLMATAQNKWVRLCMSPTRSTADILRVYRSYKKKHFGSDQYSGQEKTKLKHYDCIHIDRRTATCAGGAYDLLRRAGMINNRMLYEYLHAADTWILSVLDILLSGSGDPVAAARAHLSASPRPTLPPATILPPRAGGGGKGSGGGKRIQLSEEKAAQCRNELLCYLVITRLIHYLKKCDTVPEEVIEALKRVVTAVVEMYGEDHRVKKSILRALSHMFTSLRVPGMPMHTAEIESTIRWLFSPFRDSRKQLRSLEGMETASLQLTFIGMCRKNGVEPSEAYQRLLDDPSWDMTKHPRPPPVRRRR